MGRRLADRRRWRVSLLLLLLATAAAGPALFNLGFVNTRGGGDSPFLLFRLQQLSTALTDGHFPVRWMPDAAYGLGYPFFSYYAALPYYVGAILHLWGVGLVAAAKLTQWLGFLLAAWAMQGLVGAMSPRRRWTSWLSSAAYTFVPYHLVNIYVRGDSLGEFWAMGLYPLILWAAIRLWSQPGRSRLVQFSFAYAALILTHNISALLFSPFLLLFLLLLLWRQRGANWQWMMLGLLLGLALSAFYTLPALGEQDAVQLTAQTSGYFHYGVHFRNIAVGDRAQDLVQNSLLFDYEIGSGTPFAMGLVQAILSLAGLVAALLHLRRRDTRCGTGLAPTGVSFAILTFLLSSVMITPLSRPVWDHLPLLSLVQFPWRLLSVQALASALLIGWLAPADLPRRIGSHRIRRHLVPSLGTLLMAYSALGALRPDVIAVTSADVIPERLQLYEWFSGNIGTTIRYEYLPKAVLPRLYTSEAIVSGQPMEARVLDGAATAFQLEKRTGYESWQVVVKSDSATLAFPTLFWPGWYARVDGKRSELRPVPSLGRMMLDLSAGEHQVTLSLGRTPLRLMAELVSLAALLLSVALWLSRARFSANATRGILRSGLTLLLAGILLHLVPGPSLSDDDLTWDFDQQPYLHHSPDGVPFGDAAVMQSYQISEQAGGGWQVVVDWARVGRPDLIAVLSLVHPAQVVQGAPYTVAVDRQPVDAYQERTVFSLQAPDTAPPGPLLPRLELIEAGQVIPALTSAGRERGDLFLEPIPAYYPSQAPYLEDGIQLLGSEASSLNAERLGLTLRWGVGEPVPANWKVAVRLLDSAGDEWAALDTQPGYGFYPTGVWQPGTAFSERLTLAVPYGLAPGQYRANIALYDATSLVPRWGPLEQTVVVAASAPYDGRELLHRFSPGIAVASLVAPDAIQQGDAVSFTVGWVALEERSETLETRWELASTGAYPVASGTSRIEIESGTLILNRQTALTDPDVLPGSYQLRLSLPGADPWDAATVVIRERTRRFDLPEMGITLGDEFGGLMRLEGANLTRSPETLQLGLYWRALDAIPVDYTVFVHLFDPTTEQILTQHDAMPQDYGYPTSRWVAGEVVEDPVTLSLTDIPTGRYLLGVGLYWREADQTHRLSAVAPGGEPVPSDRVVLPIAVTIP